MNTKPAKGMSHEELIEEFREWHPELVSLADVKRDWDATRRTGRRTRVMWGYVIGAFGAWSIWKYEWLPVLAAKIATVLAGGAGQ